MDNQAQDITVRIYIKGANTVSRIENNVETEGYAKVKIAVGDKLPKQLRALFMMNPHRFQLIRETK